MSRETKRPRITRPTENRDENRRGRTQNFENREGGEREFRRPSRFNAERSDRERGYNGIRDLNKEREQSGDSDNGNRYRRETDGNRERGTREGNRFENRDNNNRAPRRSFDRDSRDNRDNRERREYRNDRDNRDNRREESIVIITVIQTVKTVVKDVRKIRIETEKIDSKTEIVTRTGEMIVGSREIGMIEESVANGFPSVPRDRLITRRHPEVYTARKSKSSFARKTRDRKQNCA